MTSMEQFGPHVFDRAHRLMTTPYAMRIFDALGRGGSPEQATGPDADEHSIAAAIAVLHEYGLATGSGEGIKLSARGERLFHGLTSDESPDGD